MEKSLSKASLSQFTGSEEFFQHFLGLIYTEGVHFMAEEGGAHWLIDAIASYQYKLSEEFQVWKLYVNKDKSAVLEMREDTHEPVKVRQEIEWTDFPLEEIKFYVVGDGAGRTLMLPSEY